MKNRATTNPRSGHFKQAAALPPDYCFPSRLGGNRHSGIGDARESAKTPARHIILATCFTTAGVTAEPSSSGKNPHKLDSTFSIVWRNLGIGYFNISKPGESTRGLRQCVPRQSRGCAAAFRARPALETAWRKTGEAFARIGETSRSSFPARRLDRRVLRAAESNRPARRGVAIARRAQVSTVGRRRRRAARTTRSHATGARTRRRWRSMITPARRIILKTRSPRRANLGEAKHLLANQSDIHYWLGCALDLLGEKKSARNTGSPPQISRATFRR